MPVKNARKRAFRCEAPAFHQGPRPLHRAAPRSIGVEPELAQFARPGDRAFPLPPQQAAQPSPQPLVESLDGPQARRVLEVTQPTAQQRVQILDRVAQRSATTAPQLLTDAVPQSLHARRRDSQARLGGAP